MNPAMVTGIGVDLPPAGAKCGWHEERPATWVCPRCGAFACRACAHRVRPDALPMCPGCWGRRAELLAELGTRNGTGLQTAALILGVVSLFPFWPVQLASLGIGVAAVIQARRPGRAHGRSRAWVGLGLTLVGVVLEVALFVWVFAEAAKHPH